MGIVVLARQPRLNRLDRHGRALFVEIAIGTLCLTAP